MNALRLTQQEKTFTKYSMKGGIRTKEKCPVCIGKFEDTGRDLVCPECKTTPKKYLVDIYLKNHGRFRIYCDDSGDPLRSYHDANIVLNDVRKKITNKTFNPREYKKANKNEYSFETRIKDWYQGKIEEVDKDHLAESYTKKLKCYKDRYFIPFFKGFDIREIRTYHIDNFKRNLPAKSPKYTKNILNALENFFKTLYRHEYIEKKPGFPVITLDRKTPKWINHESQLKILKLIPEANRPIFTFLAFQGLRPGEAMTLKVKDINFDGSYITVSRTYSNRKIRERVKSKVERPRLINPVLLTYVEGFMQG